MVYLDFESSTLRREQIPTEKHDSKDCRMSRMMRCTLRPSRTRLQGVAVFNPRDECHGEHVVLMAER